MIDKSEKDRINKGIEKAKQGLPNFEEDLALQAEATLANIPSSEEPEQSPS